MLLNNEVVSSVIEEKILMKHLTFCFGNCFNIERVIKIIKQFQYYLDQYHSKIGITDSDTNSILYFWNLAFYFIFLSDDNIKMWRKVVKV